MNYRSATLSLCPAPGVSLSPSVASTVLTGLRVSLTNATICHRPARAASPQGGTGRKASAAWNAHARLSPPWQRTYEPVYCEAPWIDWFLRGINPKLY